ncbi:MAG: electron transfer flavoprotein beta subunit/FixA family protein, partial [Candidatus Neomarinimicrobiota bacterium]
FGRVVYKSNLPCLLTTEKGLNKPRFPSLKDIMLARKKESVSENTAVAEGSLELLGLFSPEPRPAGAILGKDIGAVPELIRRLIEEAKVL